MNEREFGLKIKHQLNLGSQHLGADVQTRLQAARMKALDLQPAAVTGLKMAGTGHFFSADLLPWVRSVAGALVLTVLTAAGSYWHTIERAAEFEEVDSSLLSDDLPIDAYLDKGFTAWIKDDDQR